MIKYSDIQDTLNSLDFDKIQKVMKALNWTWCGQEPTDIDLRNQASDLLSRAAVLFEKQNDPTGWASTACGGFEARVRGLTTGGVSLQVLFYVDNSEITV